MSKARYLALAALAGCGIAGMMIRGAARHAHEAARALPHTARAVAAEIKADRELPREELSRAYKIEQQQEESGAR